MSHIVVSGKGFPTAANSQSVRETTAQGKTLSGGRTGRQGQVSAANHRAYNAYTASMGAASNQGEAVCVDIPEGAMRVSRQLWEEYGGYPDAMTAVGERGLQAGQSDGTALTKEQIASGTTGGEEIPDELKDKDKTKEDVTDETKNEEKKSKSYGVTEEGLDQLEKLLEEMKESRKSTSDSKTKGKKVLNYNFRRISSAISRAKNVNQASNALTSANSNLSSLRRKVASGQYKESELQIAMTHAKKMVRTARKKVKNIKYEDQIDKRDQGIETDKERRNRQSLTLSRGDIIRKREKQEKELRLLKKQLRQQKQQRKNAHRRGEEHDLINADMEFLRKKIDLLRQERQESSEERMADFSAQSSVMMAAGAVLDGDNTGGEMSAAEVAQAAGDAGAVMTGASAPVQ